MSILHILFVWFVVSISYASTSDILLKKEDRTYQKYRRTFSLYSDKKEYSKQDKVSLMNTIINLHEKTQKVHKKALNLIFGLEYERFPSVKAVCLKQTEDTLDTNKLLFYRTHFKDASTIQETIDVRFELLTIAEFEKKIGDTMNANALLLLFGEELNRYFIESLTFKIIQLQPKDRVKKVDSGLSISGAIYNFFFGFFYCSKPSHPLVKPNYLMSVEEINTLFKKEDGAIRNISVLSKLDLFHVLITKECHYRALFQQTMKRFLINDGELFSKNEDKEVIGFFPIEVFDDFLNDEGIESSQKTSSLSEMLKVWNGTGDSTKALLSLKGVKTEKKDISKHLKFLHQRMLYEKLFYEQCHLFLEAKIQSIQKTRDSLDQSYKGPSFFNPFLIQMSDPVLKLSKEKKRRKKGMTVFDDVEVKTKSKEEKKDQTPSFQPIKVEEDVKKEPIKIKDATLLSPEPQILPSKVVILDEKKLPTSDKKAETKTTQEKKDQEPFVRTAEKKLTIVRHLKKPEIREQKETFNEEAKKEEAKQKETLKEKSPKELKEIVVKQKKKKRKKRKKKLSFVVVKKGESQTKDETPQETKPLVQTLAQPLEAPVSENKKIIIIDDEKIKIPEATEKKEEMLSRKERRWKGFQVEYDKLKKAVFEQSEKLKTKPLDPEDESAYEIIENYNKALHLLIQKAGDDYFDEHQMKKSFAFMLLGSLGLGKSLPDSDQESVFIVESLTKENVLKCTEFMQEFKDFFPLDAEGMFPPFELKDSYNKKDGTPFAIITPELGALYQEIFLYPPYLLYEFEKRIKGLVKQEFHTFYKFKNKDDSRAVYNFSTMLRYPLLFKFIGDLNVVEDLNVMVSQTLIQAYPSRSVVKTFPSVEVPFDDYVTLEAIKRNIIKCEFVNFLHLHHPYYLPEMIYWGSLQPKVLLYRILDVFAATPTFNRWIPFYEKPMMLQKLIKFNNVVSMVRLQHPEKKLNASSASLLWGDIQNLCVKNKAFKEIFEILIHPEQW